MSKKTQAKAAGMADFFTRQKATEGIKLPLALPDGSETDHWLRIRGIDSDEFRRTDAKARREAMELAELAEAASKDEAKLAELEKQIQDLQRKVVASLVIEWSFPEPCTEANVVKFLREAPQIQTEIDRLSARRKLFFGAGSASSTPSPVANSN